MSTLLPAALLALWTVLGPLQLRRHVDLNREPWGRVMDMVRAEGDAAAQRELERVARGEVAGAEREWERSHAWRWAGQLAMRGGRAGEARRDFEQARRADPGGYDAKMAAVHLGELAAREQRWFEAERYLAPLERDADAVVAAYARNHLAPVRAQTRRLRLRYAGMIAGAAGAVVIALGAWGWRRRRAKV